MIRPPSSAYLRSIDVGNIYIMYAVCCLRLNLEALSIYLRTTKNVSMND